LTEPDQSQRQLMSFADQLLEATRSGTARWRSSSDLTAFSLETSQGAVVVDSIDRDGAAPFVLTVLNSDGAEVGSLRTDLNELLPGGQVRKASAPWNRVVSELYAAARTSAIDLEGVLGGILRDIEADKDIPF
jgi:hypothetical protein